MKRNLIRHRWLGMWAGLCLVCGSVQAVPVTIDFDEKSETFDRLFDSIDMLVGNEGNGLDYTEEGFVVTGLTTDNYDYRYKAQSEGSNGKQTVAPLGTVVALGWKEGTTIELTALGGSAFTLVDFMSSNAIFNEFGNSTLIVSRTALGGTVLPNVEFAMGMNEFASSGELGGAWAGLTSVRFTAPPNALAAIDNIRVELGGTQPIPDGGSTGVLFAGVLAGVAWLRRRLD